MFQGVTNPSALGDEANDNQGKHSPFKKTGRMRLVHEAVCRLENMANVLATHVQILNEHAPTWNLAHRLAVFNFDFTFSNNL